MGIASRRAQLALLAAIVVGALTALDFFGTTYEAAPSPSSMSQIEVLRNQYRAQLGLPSQQVECGNGWQVLAGDELPASCEEHQGTVWLRLLIGGGITFGLYKWAEDIDRRVAQAVSAGDVPAVCPCGCQQTLAGTRRAGGIGVQDTDALLSIVDAVDEQELAPADRQQLLQIRADLRQLRFWFLEHAHGSAGPSSTPDLLALHDELEAFKAGFAAH